MAKPSSLQHGGPRYNPSATKGAGSIVAAAQSCGDGSAGPGAGCARGCGHSAVGSTGVTGGSTGASYGGSPWLRWLRPRGSTPAPSPSTSSTPSLPHSHWDENLSCVEERCLGLLAGLHQQVAADMQDSDRAAELRAGRLELRVSVAEEQQQRFEEQLEAQGRRLGVLGDVVQKQQVSLTQEYALDRLQDIGVCASAADADAQAAHPLLEARVAESVERASEALRMQLTTRFTELARCWVQAGFHDTKSRLDKVLEEIGTLRERVRRQEEASALVLRAHPACGTCNDACDTSTTGGTTGSGSFSEVVVEVEAQQACWAIKRLDGLEERVRENAAATAVMKDSLAAITSRLVDVKGCIDLAIAERSSAPTSPAPSGSVRAGRHSAAQSPVPTPVCPSTSTCVVPAESLPALRVAKAYTSEEGACPDEQCAGAEPRSSSGLDAQVFAAERPEWLLQLSSVTATQEEHGSTLTDFSARLEELGRQLHDQATAAIVAAQEQQTATAEHRSTMAALGARLDELGRQLHDQAKAFTIALREQQAAAAEFGARLDDCAAQVRSAMATSDAATAAMQEAKALATVARDQQAATSELNSRLDDFGLQLRSTKQCSEAATSALHEVTASFGTRLDGLAKELRSTASASDASTAALRAHGEAIAEQLRSKCAAATEDVRQRIAELADELGAQGTALAQLAGVFRSPIADASESEDYPSINGGAAMPLCVASSGGSGSCRDEAADEVLCRVVGVVERQQRELASIAAVLRIQCAGGSSVSSSLQEATTAKASLGCVQCVGCHSWR